MQHIIRVKLRNGQHVREATISAPAPATELCIGQIINAVYHGKTVRLLVEMLEKTETTSHVQVTYTNF